MVWLCRTCNQEAEHAEAIFDKEETEILKNIYLISGIWLTEEKDVPQKICASCLMQLNEAIAFRLRCVKTNHYWLERSQNPKGISLPVEEEPDSTVSGINQEIVKVQIPPLCTLNRIKITPERGKEEDEKLSMVTYEPVFEPLTSITVSPVADLDPLMSLEAIKVETETKTIVIKPALENLPIISASEPDSKNQPIRKKRGRPTKRIQQSDLKELTVSPTDYTFKERDQIHLPSPTVKRRRGRPAKRKTDEASPGEEHLGELEGEHLVNKNQRTGKCQSIELRRKWARARRERDMEQGHFFCDQCGKTFSERGNFNVHLTRHKGVKEFQCEECDRKEFTLHLLKLHVRIKHRGELPYMCKYCGQRFDNCNLRLKHERRHKESPVHRPHVCQVCGKAFMDKETLKFHGVVHTGEQAFHCELCKVNFNRKSSLGTHYRSKMHKRKLVDQGEK
ncbi:hypothetical protein KR009_012221 [Drosophila setifemur]|nr:hypothetical protein KR009_012221 [Drosophila setifemur]